MSGHRKGKDHGPLQPRGSSSLYPVRAHQQAACGKAGSSLAPQGRPLQGHLLDQPTHPPIHPPTCAGVVVLAQPLPQGALQALEVGHLVIAGIAAVPGSKVAEDEGLGVLGAVVVVDVC